MHLTFVNCFIELTKIRYFTINSVLKNFLNYETISSRFGVTYFIYLTYFFNFQNMFFFYSAALEISLS